MINFKPKDIVALCTILAIFALVVVKGNHGFDSVLALIVGYYFAHRSSGDDTGK